MSTAVLNESVLDQGVVEDSDWALARARSGADWLDAKYGPDWDRRIDFDRLAIGSPIWCIVGQLIMHGYLSMLFATQIVDHGFSRGLLDLVVDPFADRPRQTSLSPAHRCVEDRAA